MVFQKLWGHHSVGARAGWMWGGDTCVGRRWFATITLGNTTKFISLLFKVHERVRYVR
jgi:hypothetical protein